MKSWSGGTDEEIGVEGDGEEEVGEVRGEARGEAEEGDGGGGDPAAARREGAEARRERKEIGRGRERGIGDEASEAYLPLVSHLHRLLHHCHRARHFPFSNSLSRFFCLF